MAAEVLAEGGVTVTVYDRMPSVGRKFLLAGRGGLNLTHSEGPERLLGRYGVAAQSLRPALEAFSPADVRAWSETLGQPTFVGSSGRVFPKSFKSSPLLRAWLRRLAASGVNFKPRHLWTGWRADGALSFAGPVGSVSVDPDAAVLALGGASWPRLGSDGAWASVLSEAGVKLTPLAASNCGFLTGWSDIFRGRFEGQPLKRVAVSLDGRTARGEVIVTQAGLEGGAIYALSGPIRDAIAASGEAIVQIDLRPDVTVAALERRLAAGRGKQSLATFLRKAVALAPVAVGLLHEAAIGSAERLATMPPAALATLIKSVPLRLTGTAPLARAISTAGGVAFDEIDAHFMLRSRPGVFAAGEMLDWDAPTGGYLLQAAFATGAAAGHGALKWLRRSP